METARTKEKSKMILKKMKEIGDRDIGASVG
jgi:hypothetical protein